MMGRAFPTCSYLNVDQEVSTERQLTSRICISSGGSSRKLVHPTIHPTNVSESVPSSLTGFQWPSDCKARNCNYGTGCDTLTTSSDTFRPSHNPLVVGSIPTGPTARIPKWALKKSKKGTKRAPYGWHPNPSFVESLWITPL